MATHRLSVAHMMFAVAISSAVNCSKSPTTPSQTDTWAAPSLSALETVDYEQLAGGRILIRRICCVPSANLQGTYVGTYFVNGAARTSLVTTHHGHAPVVSPDGSLVAYQELTDGTSFWDVYVSRVDGTAVERLSAYAGNSEGRPAWTPDGSQMVFALSADQSGTGAAIVTQRPSQANPNRVTTGLGSAGSLCNHPNSVHGLQISVSASGEVALPCFGYDLWLVSGAGTSARKIYPTYAGDSPPTVITAVSWSPNGSRIALIETPNGTLNGGTITVKSVDAASGQAVTLTSLPLVGSWSEQGGPDLYSLCWTADGSRIFFTAPDGSLTSYVYVVSSGGGTAVQFTTAAGVSDRSVSCTRN